MRIYSDVACGLLDHLGTESGDDRYEGQKYLCKILNLYTKDGNYGIDKLKNAKGIGGGTGWTNDDGFRFTDSIRDALMDLATLYEGPKRFITDASEFLTGKGVIVNGLEDKISSAGIYWKNTYRPYVSVSNVEKDKSAMGAIDLIVPLCVRGVTPAMLPGAHNDGSILCLAFAVMADAPATVRGSAGALAWRADGRGPVDPGLPDTCRDMMEAVIPEQLIRRMDDRLGEAAVDTVDRLLTPEGLACSRDEICRYFSEDGGHRFCQMVARCQNLMSSFPDDELLMERMSRAFGEIARNSSRPDAVNESFREIRRYSLGIAPRALAAMALALMIGPENCTAIRAVMEGR